MYFTFSDKNGNPLKGVETGIVKRGELVTYMGNQYPILEVFWYSKSKANVQIGYEHAAPVLKVGKVKPVTTRKRKAKVA